MSLQTAVALDCVMVIGQNGKFLPAQVAVVDENGHTLYNTYVRHPSYMILDYKTEMTGITEADVRNGRKFGDVTKAVESCIKYRLLVGHALWNKLECLGLRRSAWGKRDTAEYFKTEHGYQELKYLASEHGLSVQDGEEPDALENARISMKLYKKFQGKWEKSRPKVPEWWRSLSNELEDESDLCRYQLLQDEWGAVTLQTMDRRRWLAHCLSKVALYCFNTFTILFFIISIFIFYNAKC